MMNEMNMKAGCAVYTDAFDGPIKMVVIRHPDGSWPWLHADPVSFDSLEELKKDGRGKSMPTAYAATESGYVEFWPVPDADYEWYYTIDFDLWNNMHEKRVADAKLRWKRSAPAGQMSGQEAAAIADGLCSFAEYAASTRG